MRKPIDISAQGRGFAPRPSLAGNWSRYNLRDIVTKAGAVFVVNGSQSVQALILKYKHQA